MMKVIRLSVVVLVLLLTLTVVVHAQEGQPAEPDTAGEVALLLAPLVAAATAIERMIEMGFNWFESTVISASKLVGLGGDYVKWAQQRVDACRKALISISAADLGNAKEIKDAETALRDAEQRLKQWVKAEPYISVKQGLSVVAGIVLGLVVAFGGRLQMFKLLGLNLVGLNGQLLTTVDIIVTGLIIGTGSAPVHSLIGILQKSKDTLDEVRALTRARSLQAVAGLVAPAAPSAEPAAPRGFGEPAPPAKTAEAEGLSALEFQRQARQLLD